MRENVGASHLIREAGIRFVLDALQRDSGPNLWDGRPGAVAGNLTDPQRNPPIEAGGLVEVVLASSGHALLLVRDREVGKGIVRRVTRKAAIDAPGVAIRGVVGEAFRFGSGKFGEAVRDIHALFERTQGSVPGPELRFARMPPVRPCATSGLPAKVVKEGRGEGERPEGRSAVSLAKEDHRDKAWAAIYSILEDFAQDELPPPKLSCGFDDLIDKGSDRGEAPEWLGVIHADGNGLGQIFLDFDRYVVAGGGPDDRTHVDRLRAFSLALDRCTLRAFRRALSTVQGWRVADYQRRGQNLGDMPVLPLILGGDDLTVVCDGRFAVQLAHAFLAAFENETAEDALIAEIAGRALGAPRLSACAGVALVKPHYPFHAAYALAEELLKSAKTVKSWVTRDGRPYPCSALDFHVLYESTGRDLEDIRADLTMDGGSTRLVARPYVVSAIDWSADPGPDGAARDWAQPRHWSTLQAAMRATALALRREPQPGEAPAQPPNSVLHALRESLFKGADAADQRFRSILRRDIADWGDAPGRRDGVPAMWEPLVGSETGHSLFFDLPLGARTDGMGDGRATRLLDAMDLAAFWLAEETDDPAEPDERPLPDEPAESDHV